MHLKPEELVDVAEGSRAGSSVPHLAACDECRRQLAELRAMMSAARDVDVPEPPPVFWNQFSIRVREAIAAGGAPRPFWRDLVSWPLWRDLVSWPRVLIPISALAAVATVVIAIGAASRLVPRAASSGVTAPAEQLLDAQQVVEDPFLGLMADLTGGLDPDAAEEAGLTRGSAERAVTHLDANELRELQRLLQEELANSGT